MDADKKYIPTKETTNFVRLVTLLTDICTDVFRDVFDQRIPPINLATILSVKKSTLSALKVLNYEQKQLLYPQPSGTPFGGSSKDMDLSLLYILLRSICGIPPHSAGWGKPPVPGDVLLAACIESIRFDRNKIQGHVKRARVSDADFEVYWKSLSEAVTSIEINMLGGGTKYQDSITMMYCCEFSPEMEKLHVEEFKTLIAKDKQNQELIEKLNEQLLSTNMDVVTIESRLSGVQVDVNKMRHEQNSLSRTGKSLVGTGQSLVDAQKKTERQIKMASKKFTELKQDLTKEGQIFQSTQKTVVAAMSDIKQQMEYKTKQLAEMERLLTRLTNDNGNQEVKDDLGGIKKNLSELKVEICSLEKSYSAISDQLRQLQSGIEPPEDKEMKRIIEHSSDLIKQFDDQKDLVETEALRVMMKHLDESEQCAMVTGYVGQGKSTLAKEGVSRLSKKCLADGIHVQRVPVVITHPDQWQIVVRSKTPMVVCIDDIFGKSNFDQSMVAIWSQLFDDMQLAISNGKVILIMTMRKHIFDDAKKYLLEHKMFQENCVVDLTSETLRLTKPERRNILNAHIESRESRAVISENDCEEVSESGENDSEKMKISLSIVEAIVERSTGLSQHLGYPQCCRMFVSDKTYLKQGAFFFENPVDFLKSHLDKMHSIDEIAYFTLCYTLFSNNRMYLEDFHEMPEKTENGDRIYDIALVCGISKNSFWDLLVTIPKKVKALNGSFLSFNRIEGCYELSHRSVSDALCWSFGNLSRRKLVEHCPVEFLCENVRTRYCPRGSEEMVLDIVPKFYLDLARRVTHEIFNGNVIEISRHVILQDADFVKVLLQHWKDTGSLAKVLNQNCTAFGTDKTRFSLLVTGDELLKQVVKSGELETLEDKKLSDKIKEEAITHVCSVTGDFDVYMRLISCFALVTPDCLIQGASSNFYDILEDLLCRFKWGSVDLSKARMKAILKENFHCYKLLVDHDDASSLCCEDLLHCVERSLEEFVTYLLQVKDWSESVLTSSLEKACEVGNVEVFNLLLHTGSLFTEDCLGYAAEHTDGKILSALLELNLWSDKEVGVALARGLQLCNDEGIDDHKESNPHETLLQSASLSKNALGECLIEMIRLQKMKEAEDLIEKYPDTIHYIDNKCETTLHHAVGFQESQELVKSLLQKGIDVHLGNYLGKTPLHCAASFGHTDVAEILISHGADVNVQDDIGFTALHCAAKVGRFDTAKLLVHHGADINAEDNCHFTPICCLASYNPDLDFVVFLASKGAKLHGYHLPWSAEYLLCRCVEMSNLDVLKDFLEKGVFEQQDLNAALLRVCQQDIGNFEMYKCLLDRKASPSAGCLMEATFWKYDDICSDLLDREVEWSEKELSKSLQFSCRNGNYQIYDKLLKSGAMLEVDCLMDALEHIEIFTDILSRQVWSDHQLGSIMAHPSIAEDNKGKICDAIIKTASSTSSVVGECLCEAVRFSNFTTAKEMISKYNSDVNFSNEAGCTPLHIAAVNTDDEMIEYLLGKGANTQIRDGCGKTPFLNACCSNHLQNVKILCKHSTFVKDMKDLNGRNGLHLAANSGSEEVFSHLLSHGFNISDKDNDDNSHLHFSADKGNTNMCRLMIKKGIYVNVINKDGQSALHVAMKKGNSDVATYLLQCGADIELQDKTGMTPFPLAPLSTQHQVMNSVLEEVLSGCANSMIKLCFLVDYEFIDILRSVAVQSKSCAPNVERSMENSLCLNSNRSLSMIPDTITNRKMDDDTSSICSMPVDPYAKSGNIIENNNSHDSGADYEHMTKSPSSIITIPIFCSTRSRNMEKDSNSDSSLAHNSHANYKHMGNSTSSIRASSIGFSEKNENMTESSNSFCSLPLDSGLDYECMDNTTSSYTNPIVSSAKPGNMTESSNSFCSLSHDSGSDYECITNSTSSIYTNSIVFSASATHMVAESTNSECSLPHSSTENECLDNSTSSFFTVPIIADANGKEMSASVSSLCSMSFSPLTEARNKTKKVESISTLPVVPVENKRQLTESFMSVSSLRHVLDGGNDRMVVNPVSSLNNMANSMNSIYSLTDSHIQCNDIYKTELNKGMVHACKMGNYDFYDILLDLGAQLTDGCLKLAVESKCKDLINDLLIQRQNWNAIDLESAKYYVIESGNIDLFMTLFLMEHAEVDSKCFLLSLHHAQMSQLMLDLKEWSSQDIALFFVHSWPLGNSNPLPGFDTLLSKACSSDEQLLACFFEAVTAGNENILYKMIELKVDVASRNCDGLTGIHIAALKGHQKIINILLENGASFVVSFENMPLLHWAMKNCSIEIFKFLIQKGAPLQVKDSQTFSILRAAINSKMPEAVKSLLEAGVSVDEQDGKGRLPIHQAVIADDMAIVGILIENGALIDDRDYEDCTPLHLVAEEGLAKAVQPLISRGAYIDDKDSSGRTPLLMAAENQHLSTVVELLQHGACVSVINTDGFSALHIAVMKNNFEMCTVLLKHKADVNCKDWNQRIPLHYAVIGSHIKIVKLCVKYGFNKSQDAVDQENINCADDRKSTPLHYAVDNGDLEIMLTLLKHGAVVDAKDCSGKGPLHIACKHSDKSCAEVLVNHGAIINVRDANGDTPLHIAVQSGNSNCVRFLLEQGANVSLANKQGLTPLDLATRGSNGKSSTILSLFRQYLRDDFEMCATKNECRIM